MRGEDLFLINPMQSNPMDVSKALFWADFGCSTPPPQQSLTCMLIAYTAHMHVALGTAKGRFCHRFDAETVERRHHQKPAEAPTGALAGCGKYR